MWTLEAIEMHSAMLKDTEQVVLKALSLGYDLEDAYDFVSHYEHKIDMNYAKAYIESLKYPDKHVPLDI